MQNASSWVSDIRASRTETRFSAMPSRGLRYRMRLSCRRELVQIVLISTNFLSRASGDSAPPR
jgi:hypothetical protein